MVRAANAPCQQPDSDLSSWTDFPASPPSHRPAIHPLGTGAVAGSPGLTARTRNAQQRPIASVSARADREDGQSRQRRTAEAASGKALRLQQRVLRRLGFTSVLAGILFVVIAWADFLIWSLLWILGRI